MKHVNEQQTFFYFHDQNKPVMTMEPGETISFSNEDCFHNLLTDETKLKSELVTKGVIINPTTGPVYVNGAMPGDTLKVHVDNVEVVGGYGTMAVNKADFGVVGDYVDEEQTMRVPIVDGEAVLFGGKLRLPVRLMVGVLGVTPKGKFISTLQPGDFGGNMDCKLLRKGTTLYLPVAVEGALLAMGDVHALQADGEMPCALEVPGKITVTVELIKNRSEAWPALETDDAWYVLTSAPTADEANRLAVRAMADFLVKRSAEYTPTEWAVLLGMAGDLEICQIADPWPTSRYKMPKSITKNMVF